MGAKFQFVNTVVSCFTYGGTSCSHPFQTIKENVSIAEKYGDVYKRQPGITGMWQVSGRSDITDFEEVVRLDKEYIENWDIGLDTKILLKTVMVVVKKDGSM